MKKRKVKRWFERCMEARSLWVKNTRALWIARAKRAIEKIAWFKLWNASISTMNPEDGARQEYDKWKKALGKFLKKSGGVQMSELHEYHYELRPKEYEIFYLKYEVDALLAEKDKEIESLKASHYAEMVDAGMRERRLNRALWVTRTAMAKSEKDRWNAHIDCGNRRNRKDPAYVKTGKLLETSEWRKLWADIERKCRAKAEEYK